MVFVFWSQSLFRRKGGFFFSWNRFHEETVFPNDFPLSPLFLTVRPATSSRSFRRETKSSEINTSPEDIPLEISPQLFLAQGHHLLNLSTDKIIIGSL